MSSFVNVPNGVVSVPSSLTAGQWRVARGPVVAAVAGVPGLPPSQQRPFVSVLCRFLAASSWDGATVPDLASLLTASAIESVVTSSRFPEVGAKALASYRTSLRRIGRSLGSVPPWSPPKQDRPVLAAGRFWFSVSQLTVPFPALAHVFAATGRQVCSTMWSPHGARLACPPDLFSVLVPGWANDATGDASSLSQPVPNVDFVAQLVRDADDVQPLVVTAMPTSKPSRRQRSGTGQARAARAALKAAQSARTAVVGEASLPALDAAVDAAVTAYRPKHFSAQRWRQIGDVSRHALRAYRPTSVRWVQDQGGQVTGFVGWVADRCAAQGVRFGAECLLVAGLVDNYLVAEMSGRPDASRATTRSVLRRVVRNLGGTGADQISYVPVRPPYTPAECAAFVRLARNQPTPDSRRALSAMVALGLGAGLDGGDQRRVTRADVARVELTGGGFGFVVRVRGQRPRTVVVRRAYEQLLCEALELHDRGGRDLDAPLYGQSCSRRNVTSTVTGKAVTATGAGVDISVARLRATWLVACMNAPVPLSVLLAAAGLKSARTLTDLLEYCPPARDVDMAMVRDAVDGDAAGELS